MAKTACDSLQTARKYVPVHDLMKPAQISQTVPCWPLNWRFYTLCEVDNGDRQFVPPLEPAFLRRKNRPCFGPIGRSDSALLVTLGISAKNVTGLTTHPTTEKRPANPLELPVDKPFFGGAA